MFHQFLLIQQYATLAKKITDVTTPLRDLYYVNVSKQLDAYFISFLFRKLLIRSAASFYNMQCKQ